MWDADSYANDGRPCKAVDGTGDARMKATYGGPRG